MRTLLRYGVLLCSFAGCSVDDGAGSATTPAIETATPAQRLRPGHRPGDLIDSTSAPATAADHTLPACSNGELKYCDAYPLAPGAWVGDGGPFVDLVFTDLVCADDGYCFFGHLDGGARVDGTYYVAPESLVLKWGSASFTALTPETSGTTLAIYGLGADEAHPLLIESFRAVRSLCDDVKDCVDQPVAASSCLTRGLDCIAHTCARPCE